MFDWVLKVCCFEFLIECFKKNNIEYEGRGAWQLCICLCKGLIVCISISILQQFLINIFF